MFLWLAVRAQLARILAYFVSVFGTFFVHFGLPGVPGMVLGTRGDHLCAGISEKDDFGRFWGARWNPLGDPAGTLFRLWTPLGPSRRAFRSDLLAVLVAPGFDLDFGAPNSTKTSFFGALKVVKV